jgi:hypothetical protein
MQAQVTIHDRVVLNHARRNSFKFAGAKTLCYPVRYLTAKPENKSRWMFNLDWRKPVGVEPTSDTRYRSPGLKPGPSTGQDWLPSVIVASVRGSVRFFTIGGAQ